MKVLIVGNDSMVGRSVKMRLGATHKVMTAGRNRNADFFIDLAAPNSEFPADLGKFDVIIHCAASFCGNFSTGAIQNEMVNSVGALQIGLVARQTECKHVIYLSSTSCYDVPENQYFGSYGLSKRHGQENLMLACREFSIGFTALLPSQIYDIHGEARNHQPLFYRIIDQARAGNDIEIYGVNNPQRNYLFVEDLAIIIEKVIERRCLGIFPCVHPRSYSLSAMAELAYKVFGKGGKVVFLPEKPDILNVYIPQDEKLYALIDYSPATDLESGIKRIAEAMSGSREG